MPDRCALPPHIAQPVGFLSPELMIDAYVQRAVIARNNAYARRHGMGGGVTAGTGVGVVDVAGGLFLELEGRPSLRDTHEGRLLGFFLVPSPYGHKCSGHQGLVFLAEYLEKIGHGSESRRFLEMARKVYVPPPDSPGMSWKQAMAGFQRGMDAHFRNMDRRDAVGRSERARAANTEARRNYRERAKAWDKARR